MRSLQLEAAELRSGRTLGVITTRTQTVGRNLRVLDAGAVTSTMSTLSNRSMPPAWIGSVVDEASKRDRDGLLAVRTLVKLAQFLVALPSNAPRPIVGVGDDETVGLEWDLTYHHLEVQVGNAADDDQLLIEDTAADESVELQMEGNRVLFSIMMGSAIRAE